MRRCARIAPEKAAPGPGRETALDLKLVHESQYLRDRESFCRNLIPQPASVSPANVERHAVNCFDDLTHATEQDFATLENAPQVFD
jgi:hypothetical protein